VAPRSLKQRFVPVGSAPNDKCQALVDVLGPPREDGGLGGVRTLVFCNSKDSARFVDHYLTERRCGAALGTQGRSRRTPRRGHARVASSRARARSSRARVSCRPLRALWIDAAAAAAFRARPSLARARRAGTRR
jgi:hypothetical protein